MRRAVAGFDALAAPDVAQGPADEVRPAEATTIGADHDRPSGAGAGRPAVAAALLALLLGAALALQAGELGTWLWIDEGISVGLASHPIAEIPGLLARDGSPPLYYLVLHAWMAVFGTTETATHALSLVVFLVTIPVALWAGWSLFGPRVGWTLAALVGLSPYLGQLSTETRMYALAVLLSLVASAAFLHAFCFRRRGYVWVFAASLALVLYTHNWGLWLAAAAVVALVPCARVATDRRLFLRDALVGFGAVALAYLPWLPTLLFQASHTGAPWSPEPSPREVVSVVAAVLGDRHERVIVALLFVAGPVLWSLLRGGGQRQAAVVATAILAGLPVVLGWVAAQATPSWAARYLAVCAPAVFLLAALGLSLAGTRGLVALGLILALWVQPFARAAGLRPSGDASKGLARPLAHALATRVDPGDVVIVMQMEEMPVLAYYLPRGVRFATPTGPVADPTVPDWRDAVARTAATSVATGLRPVIDGSPVGSDVVLVCAQSGTGPLSLPWFALMEQRCDEWRSALTTDARLTPFPASFQTAAAAVGGRQVLGFTKTAA